MTFTPVIPTTWDTTSLYISQFIDAIIAGFQAAVPGVIRKQWSDIPASFTGEVPLVYVGDVTESILHDMGLRQTTFAIRIGYVDVSPDNPEANTRANSFRDYMREVFTANARIYSTGIFQQVGIHDEPASQGPLVGFMHLVLDATFVILEGRN